MASAKRKLAKLESQISVATIALAEAPADRPGQKNG